MKKKISAAIDRLLKKIEDEVMKGAEKVLEKALETAATSWDLKETESATQAEATRQIKEVMQKALADAKEELKKLYEDFKGVAEKAGTEMLMNLAMGTDAAADSADQSVAAAGEVQDNPVRKADDHSKAAEAKHDELSKANDAEKDKHEEQTRQFVGGLKEQYGKLHELGEKMQGPLGEAVQKSGVSVDKSAGILMAQARGAIDQVAAAYGDAKAKFDDAQKHRASIKDMVAHIPEIGDHVEGAFAQLQSAHDEGSKAFERARQTVKEHEKEIAAEAEKLTQAADE